MNEQFLQWLSQQNPDFLKQLASQYNNIPTGTPNVSESKDMMQNMWNAQGKLNVPNTNFASGITAPTVNYAPQAYKNPLDVSTYTQSPAMNADLSFNNNGLSYNPNAVDPNFSQPAQEPQQQAATQTDPRTFLNTINAITNPVSTDTAVFKLGQSLEFNTNNPYATQGQKNLNTVRGIAAAGKTLTSLLRTGFAGAAYQNKMNDTMTEYYNKQSRQNFQQQENGGYIYEDGGQIPQDEFLTGAYIGNQPNPNSNIENNEFVQYPDGQVVQAVGNTHEQGGIDVNLPPSTKVISDNLKIGGKTAREIKKQYDIDVKANHTYAEVIEKYKKKIGLQKLDDEQAELFKKLEKNGVLKDNDTKSLNDTFLGQKVQDIEKSKSSLQQDLSMFTDYMFQKQEASKPVENTSNVYEYGGKRPSKYEKSSYEDQKQTDAGLYGDVNAQNYDQRILEIQRNHPEIYSQLFEGKGLKKGKTWADYQRAINQKYDKIAEDVKQLYGADSEQYKQAVTDLGNAKFIEGDKIKGFDSKFGDFTSSRGTYSLDILPVNVYSEVQKAGVGTAFELKQKFPEYYNQYVASKGLTSDFNLGIVPQQEAEQEVTTEQTTVPNQRVPFGGLQFTDQSLPAPSSVQAARMSQSTYRPYETIQQSYEPQVRAISVQQAAAVEQLTGLTPEQRAIAASQISANSQLASNEAIGQVNAANQQEAAKISNLNTELFNNYSKQRESEREAYEAKTFQAQATTNEDLMNWFRYNNNLNALNQRQENEARTLASLYQYYTLSPTGEVVNSGQSPVFNNPTKQAEIQRIYNETHKQKTTKSKK